MTTNTLALQKTSNNSWLIAPANMSEMFRFAEMIAQSTFCPKDMRGRPGDVLAAIQMGAELGISAMQALQGIAVINGRPSIYGDLFLAVLLAEPSVVDVSETWDPATCTATCTLIRKRGDRERVTTRTFSYEDAKKAKLWGKSGPWSEYPDRMCMFRARSWAGRDGAADVLKGLITREEAMDIPTEVRAAVIESKPVTASGSHPTSGAINDQAQAEVVTDPSPLINYVGHPHNGQRMSVLDVRGCLVLALKLEKDIARDPGAVKWPSLPGYLEAVKAYGASRGVQEFTRKEMERLEQLQAAINDGGKAEKKEDVVDMPLDEDDLHLCVHPDAGEDSERQKDIRNWTNNEHLLEYGTWLADEYKGADKALRVARVEARIAKVAEVEALLAEAALMAQQAEDDAKLAEDEAARATLKTP